MNWYRLLEWLCRWISGCIFILSSYHKIMDPCRFASDISHYQIAPLVLINLIAITLPFIELLLGIALIVGILPRGAALGIMFTLLFFITLLSINVIRGLDFSCGCFNPDIDSCEIFADWYKTNHPEITNLVKARIRSGCDIVRDILFLIPTIGALLLLNRRFSQH